MSDVPVQFVVAAFQGGEGAQEALDALKQGHNDGLIRVEQAAVLQKTPDGALHITETSDMGPVKGAFIGALLGAGVGLLLGPVGWMAAGGAGVGALAAELRDSGFNDARLNQFGESLTPGSSALIALVEQTSVEKVKEIIADKAVAVVNLTIAEDISQRLKASDDVLWDVETPTENSVTDRPPTSGTPPA
jgi:uncharacterized membrane protein